MFSGLAVNALGYGNPAVVRAIRKQAGLYTHLSNYYLQEPQIWLAELLVSRTGFPRVFFCNSGTEAVEGAIKIVRRWGNLRKKREIVSFSNAFHGRTMGALSLMDRPRYRDGFGPFLNNFRIAEFNDAPTLRRAVGRKTAAVVLEVVQGEGGIRPISAEFAATLNQLRTQYGFLIVADEIQSGLGRTGTFFAFQHYSLSPDIVLMAKPIGGGLPLGAILGAQSVADVLEPGMHGTTFGGNPVACAAGIAVLTEIERRKLMNNAEAMGALLLSGLRRLAGEFPMLVREVRGLGLMAGMELTVECEPAVTAMRERGILINGTDRTVLRFLPPLIVKPVHITRTITALRAVLAELARHSAG
jgi:acetylornithine aminotransferase